MAPPRSVGGAPAPQGAADDPATPGAPPPGCSRRAAVGWALGVCAWPARAQAFDLPTLMQRLARRQGGEARFTEERIVSGFDSPLTASGTLSFAAPDRFARHTLHPVKESMEVQGRTLLLRRGGRTRQMEMDALPEVGALLEALRATLTGDLAVLQRHFATDFTGHEGRWILRLKPLDPRLARQLLQIELVGQGVDVRSVALQLAGGDRSLMLLEPLSPAAAPR